MQVPLTPAKLEALVKREINGTKLGRTQEIKEEKAEEDGASAADKEKSTFWGRVARMFRDFWSAVTGVFH